MAGAPLWVGFTGGELAAQACLVARHVMTDEDGLALGGGRELHPGELVPSAREIEQALPVPIAKAHDPLGAHDVVGQAREQPLEARLIERTIGAVQEAADAVLMQVIAAAPRAIAEPGDARREEDLAVDRAAHRAEALRARVQRLHATLARAGGLGVDQIELVQHDEVRRLDLQAGHVGLREVTVDVGRVDHRDDRVEPEARGLHAMRERLRIGESRRLDDDQVRLRGGDDFLDGHVESVVVDGAADAAARELDHLLDGREARDHAPVDAHFADLVHDDGHGLPRQAVVEHVAKQRRLAASEEAGEDVDGDGPHAKKAAQKGTFGCSGVVPRSQTTEIPSAPRRDRSLAATAVTGRSA
jgi:hypothetical protein